MLDDQVIILFHRSLSRLKTGGSAVWQLRIEVNPVKEQYSSVTTAALVLIVVSMLAGMMGSWYSQATLLSQSNPFDSSD